MNGMMKPKGRVDTQVLEDLVQMLGQHGNGEPELTEDNVLPLSVSVSTTEAKPMEMEKRCPTCGQPMAGMGSTHGASTTNDAQ
jgi:hypothetical protein